MSRDQKDSSRSLNDRRKKEQKNPTLGRGGKKPGRLLEFSGDNDYGGILIQGLLSDYYSIDRSLTNWTSAAGVLKDEGKKN